MMTIEEKTARRDARKKERSDKKELARIDELKSQKPVKSMTITIEWKKSHTWGMNPSATARIEYHDGSYGMSGPFSCSGCGYDKESTVIADIFNDVLRYKLFQKHNGKAPYGMYYYGGETGLNNAGLKHEYTLVPQYNGGVGTSCYYNIAQFIGGKFYSVASGKTFDVYEYSE